MQKKTFLNLMMVGLAAALWPRAELQAQTWENITANVSVTLRGDARAMDSDGTRLYVLTQTNGVYVSSDNGNSFTAINDVEGGVYGMTNQPGRFIKYVNGSMWVGWDPGSGAINLGEASLHRLTPGETVWHKSSSGFPIGDTGNQADDIAYDSSTGTYYAAAALGGAFVSSDGMNWQQRATGLGGVDLPVTMVAFDGMAFEARGLEQVQRTSNQGTNWTALQSHQGYSTGLMIEKSGRLMFICNTPDGFRYSDDHGDTWRFLTNGVRQLGDLTVKDGIIYGSGLIYGSVFESFLGRPGFKFSATDGITWDNLPTNGLSVDPLGSLNLTRVVRQGDYLFTYFNSNGVINLYRFNVSGFDFTPTTQIAQQPPATTNFLVGQTVSLSVLAGGANLAYQWMFKGTNIAGATSATYSIPSVQTNNAGAYQVVVTGDRGSVTSSVVTLNVGLRGDGRYDITYNNPTTGGWIYLEPDGSLVSVNGANLYKLNPAGERAITRNIGGATFFAGLLDSSNRVVLAGRFTQAPSGSRLIRASGVDLTDDATFHLPYVNGDYSVLAELPGRGYLAGGSFTTVTNSGIATNVVNHFCLINYSGVVDTNFVFSPSISQISKIVVVGRTNIYISATANKSDIKKVNLDGTYDTNFSNVFPGNNIGYYESYVSNKLFVVVSSKPVLVNPDGTLDGSFNAANAVFNNTVTAMAVGESNKLYVAGTFTTYNGQSVGKYARLFPDGTLDTSFYTESPTSGGFNWDVYDPRGYLYLVRDTSSGTFQGQSYSTGPYRLFAGTNAVASTGNPTFSQWAAQFTFPPGQSGAADDADGDGVKNIFEYYFGSNPTNATSGAQPTETTVNVASQNYPAITFIRSRNVTGVTLLPQVSSTVNFTDSLGYTVQSVVDLGNGTEQVIVRSNASMMSQTAQFLRIQLSVP
jgi:hypothetical protein